MRRVAFHGSVKWNVGSSVGSTAHGSGAIRGPGHAQRWRPGNKRGKEHLMLDIVMLALGFGLFAAGIGYAYACERL